MGVTKGDVEVFEVEIEEEPEVQTEEEETQQEFNMDDFIQMSQEDLQPEGTQADEDDAVNSSGESYDLWFIYNYLVYRFLTLKL